MQLRSSNSRQSLRRCQEPGSIILEKNCTFQKKSPPCLRLLDTAAFARPNGFADVGGAGKPFSSPDIDKAIIPGKPL